MTSFLGSSNISYFTVPAAFILAILPRTYSGFSGPGAKYFNNQNPRDFQERLAKAEDIDKELKLRLMRAESCSANAFENLPLFAAAVVAANSAGVPKPMVNVLSLGYIASRIGYTWIYIWGQNNRKLAPARTVVWFLGIACEMTLFVQAGLKLQWGIMYNQLDLEVKGF